MSASDVKSVPGSKSISPTKVQWWQRLICRKAPLYSPFYHLSLKMQTNPRRKSWRAIYSLSQVKLLDHFLSWRWGRRRTLHSSCGVCAKRKLCGLCGGKVSQKKEYKKRHLKTIFTLCIIQTKSNSKTMYYTYYSFSGHQKFLLLWGVDFYIYIGSPLR